MTGSDLMVLALASLAGARTYRLIAIDSAGEPVRKLIRRVIFKLGKSGRDHAADLVEEGAECPYCIGYWLTAAWVLTGLLWGGTFVWVLVAGSFAANYIGASLNAWLDVRPIKDGGGDVDIMEEK